MNGICGDIARLIDSDYVYTLHDICLFWELIDVVRMLPSWHSTTHCNIVSRACNVEKSARVILHMLQQIICLYDAIVVYSTS